jgi:glucose-1-phosphate adenylyltransferase
MMPTLNDILAIILAGGQGSRLYPLTKLRSKPAVPMAGKYRLIDIPISNCINSRIYRIAILTQFNSVSLNRHINNTYNFDAFHTGWVQIWAAQQTIENAGWYQGTADAIRKQIFQIQSVNAPYTLILAGDHLYRMDYAGMAEAHWRHDADITVAVQPVPAGDAQRYGLLKRNASLKITDFAEKPKDPVRLKEFISRDDPEKPYLASMGIYLFKTSVLIDLLSKNAFDDFGSHVIPSAIQTHSVIGYDFEGYWEDIGTIRSFYETNLALTTCNSRFDLFDAVRPIYSHARFLPASRIEASSLHDALIAEGCCVAQAEITHSIIGLRSQVGTGVKIKDTIIMGSDYYEMEHPMGEDSIPMGIGAGCQIEGAIIDKNARLGANVTIRPFPRGTDITREDWVVRDGIVVIPKGTTLLPGTMIRPGTAD